ncbi:MAG: transposase [Chitinophagaceae bacterium]
MQFKKNHVYHVYNRGNNKERTFFTVENYDYFLRKIKKEWSSQCDIIAYCLMPNHFHFMLIPNEEGCKYVNLGGRESQLQQLSRTIGKTLSSYTRAINKQRGNTGNLFQQKTKSKNITDTSLENPAYHLYDYLRTCFHYIHNNPVAAGMTDKPGDWPFSSMNEYLYLDENLICNTILTFKILGIKQVDLKNQFVEVNEELVAIVQAT